MVIFHCFLYVHQRVPSGISLELNREYGGEYHQQTMEKQHVLPWPLLEGLGRWKAPLFIPYNPYRLDNNHNQQHIFLWIKDWPVGPIWHSLDMLSSVVRWRFLAHAIFEDWPCFIDDICIKKQHLPEINVFRRRLEVPGGWVKPRSSYPAW